MFPQKEPEADSIEITQIADLRNSILDDLLHTVHPSEVCTNIFDVSALMIRHAATVLFSKTHHQDFFFLDHYRKAIGDLVCNLQKNVFVSAKPLPVLTVIAT